MIRRPAGKDCLLITQLDHAVLSGQLAEQIGNGDFDPPAPRGPALLAISGHDAGWPLHDDRPALNPAGLPLHVFETPLPLATRIWGESARRLAGQDPYAGLLASLHQLALSDVATRRDPSPHERQQGQRDLFELNKFQHQQVELQERLRQQLGMRTDLPLKLGLARPGADAEDDRLRFNFRYLAAMDRISLQLCCGKALFEEIEEVLPRAGGTALTLTLRDQGPDALTVDPWPFKAAEVRCGVRGKRLPGRPFADEAEFRRAYAEAPGEALEFVVRHG